MARGLIIGVLILLGITACATRSLLPLGSEESLQLEEDESRLWKRAAEEQEILDKSGHIYEDPLLTAYVNEVAQRLVPEECKQKGLSFQVRVIENPLLNAFAYPNGFINVHMGILAKMENEAQLAALLGHEMTHVINRHAVQNFRSVKSKTFLLAMVRVATLPFGIYATSITNILGTLGTIAAVTGYSRELEREADRVGFELMVKAGYDPKEAPRLFEHLKRDVEEQKTKEPFFFGSHPCLQERIDSYNQLIETGYVGEKGEKSAEGFMEKILPLILDNAALDLSMGRFSSAQRGIETVLNTRPRDATAHYYLAEVYRQRCEEGDKERAEQEYLLAAQYNPSYPEPHKGLGLMYYKEGREEQAREHLERYLSLAPQAEDRGHIEQYLHNL